MRPRISYGNRPIDALEVKEQDSSEESIALTSIPPTHYGSATWHQSMNAAKEALPSSAAASSVPVLDRTGESMSGRAERTQSRERLALSQETYAQTKATLVNRYQSNALSEGEPLAAAEVAGAGADRAVAAVQLPKHNKATRLAAARRMAELWKESGNGKTDGVEYQNRMRTEWQ